MLAKQSLAKLSLWALSFGSAIALRFGKEMLSLIPIRIGTRGSSWESLLHWGLEFSKVGLLPGELHSGTLKRPRLPAWLWGGLHSPSAQLFLTVLPQDLET